MANRLLVVCAIQEGDHLGAVADSGGAEGGGGQSGGNAVFHGPKHGLVVEFLLVDIGEGATGCADLGASHCAVEEGDYLGAVADGVGTEVGGVQTVGDALLHGPEDGLLIEAAALDIYEGMLRGSRLRTVGGAPEEGHHLGAVAADIGAEVGGGDTAGDALVHGPGHGKLIEAAGDHIVKGGQPGHAAAAAFGSIPIMAQGRDGPAFGLAAAGAGALLHALGGTGGSLKGLPGAPAVAQSGGLIGNIAVAAIFTGVGGEAAGGAGGLGDRGGVAVGANVDLIEDRLGPVGHIPDDLAVCQNGSAVAELAVKGPDAALGLALAVQEAVFLHIVLGPGQEEPVRGELQQMGRGDGDVVGFFVIGQPVELGILVGEGILGGGGDEDVPVDLHQVGADLLVIGAACHQIVRGGKLKAAQTDAGVVVVIGGADDGQGIDHGGLAVEGLGTGLLAVLEQGHGPGIVVAVVHGQQGIAVHPDELVEGMADIAVGAVPDLGQLVRDLHVADAQGDHHVGLMVQTILGGVHLMGGADVEDIAAAVEAAGTGIEGDGGVGTIDAGVVHLFPVLGVADDPEDLLAVVLLEVGLAHHQEIVVGGHVNAAVEGQLQLDGLAGAELKVLGVIFHHQLVAQALGPDVFAVFIGEVGVDRRGPALGVDIPVAVQIAADGTTGSPGRRNQTADQHQSQDQGKNAFHNGFSFHSWDGFIIEVPGEKVKKKQNGKPFCFFYSPMRFIKSS